MSASLHLKLRSSSLTPNFSPSGGRLQVKHFRIKTHTEETSESVRGLEVSVCAGADPCVGQQLS